MGCVAVRLTAYSVPGTKEGSLRGSTTAARPGEIGRVSVAVRVPSSLVNRRLTVVGCGPRSCTISVVSQPSTLYAKYGAKTWVEPSDRPWYDKDSWRLWFRTFWCSLTTATIGELLDCTTTENCPPAGNSLSLLGS